MKMLNRKSAEKKTPSRGKPGVTMKMLYFKRGSSYTFMFFPPWKKVKPSSEKKYKKV
jgi:hypothetical protein